MIARMKFCGSLEAMVSPNDSKPPRFAQQPRSRGTARAVRAAELLSTSAARPG